MSDSVTDFSQSYVRWSIPPDPGDTRQPGHMPWGNSVRIQIDATCTISSQLSGESETFYLIAPCRKEWMYRETGLIMDPGAEYRVIFSQNRQLDVAMSVKGHGDWQLPARTDGFTSLKFEIRSIAATQLQSCEAVVKASEGQAPIVARTEITNAARGLTALLEYPIRTMNYHPERKRFQVDTGPLIFADLSLETTHSIEHCKLAHTVYNTFDYAEFVCRPLTPQIGDNPGDVRIYHYSEIHRDAVSHALFTPSEMQ